jgi:hypothetical protein
MPFGVLPKEDRHDIRETFADSLSQCVFDGQTLRLELSSTRLDEAKPPPAKPTGRRHVVARIVLTPGGAIELFNACMQIAGQFKQAGILKENPARPYRTGAPKRRARFVPNRSRGAPNPSRYRSTASNSRWRACCADPTKNLEFRGALAAHAIPRSPLHHGSAGPLVDGGRQIADATVRSDQATPFQVE